MSFNARVSYTANGSTNTFSFSFPYILTSHVKAFVNGVEDTNITFPTSSSVQLSSTPANGAVVLIQRITPSDARLVDFQDGSVLTSSDLDRSADQNFFISQETSDDVASKLGLDASDRFDANNKRIINVANPTDAQDAVTKHYLENTWLSPTDKSNINTVAGISGIATLASNNANINTVATNIANVNAVGNDIAKVIETANDLQEAVSEIDVVATNIANVNLVGADIANVNTVATNVSAVNAFGSTYKISANAPTGIPEGTLWFDTTNDVMKVYDGNAFQNAGSSVNGTSQRNKFIATANQTTFSGSDADGVTLAYDPNFLDVYLNGIRLVNSTDYTATNGSSIVLSSGASVGDILNIVSFGTFNIASFSATAITSDTLPIARGGTGLNSVSGQAGKALIVNSNANGFELANASSAEVYGFIKSFTASTVNYTITVQSVGGGNKYFINGEQQPTLELLEGNTYVFNYPSAHPFKFSTTSNGSHGGGSEYTTGVTHNSSTQVTIVVASGAPTLYYYCSSHSGMGGQANTPVPANNTLQVITTNQGQDNITNAQYNSFTDTLFSASGFTFSLNSSGSLIATI